MLSLYLIALVLMPCTDNVSFDDGSECSLSAISSCSDHHEEENDTCAPFCHCMCCGHVCSFEPIMLVSCSPQVVSVKDVPGPDPHLLKEVCFSIWQPPKIL